ncbi:ATP synthase F1 subunit delta [Alicyclobacillus mengziensis]|uniref:ATP synthase subunit delta n=1 Tax=Alicyclobacillus mengziensis TaxID=2931921 RepID=A0A9X7VYU0_9BACL|nr:ATP synthase F1 subunit delta [Alicyclobacillus mengziensis]QSO47593.1 ATP synthase F1 subunit delta [Alicyclobacillus mengziensis]
MLSGTVTNRYTEGLYGAAKDSGVVDAVDISLQEIANVLDSNPDFRVFLEHPVIPSEAKSQLVKEVFGQSVHPLCVRFLDVLIERKRTAYVRAVVEAFHNRAEQDRGSVIVHVETALPLSDDEAQVIRQKLASALNKEPQTIVEVNPELIAGYRFRVGNRVIDATVRGALQQFAQKLTASGAVEEGNR